MIVFDVDGTLIGGEEIDWRSFEDAFAEVSGGPFPVDFFSRPPEMTAKAIVHEALAARSLAERNEIERAVEAAFLKKLKAAQARNAEAFPAIRGSAELLVTLKEHGVRVAIATGDWREPIRFKLAAAGLAVDDIPMVTSSEQYGRAEIIAAAVTQAGGNLSEAIYVGDGPWDLRACALLGIPFIGVGKKRELLLSQGARHALEDLTPVPFWEILQLAQASRHAQTKIGSR